MKDLGKMQVINRENLCAQFSQHNGIRIPLLKDIDAEASLANQRVGTIARSLGN
jgi:hypothetical protein